MQDKLEQLGRLLFDSERYGGVHNGIMEGITFLSLLGWVLLW